MPSRHTGLAPVRANSSRSTSMSGVIGPWEEMRCSPFIVRGVGMPFLCLQRSSGLTAQGCPCRPAHQGWQDLHTIPCGCLDAVASGEGVKLGLGQLPCLLGIERVPRQPVLNPGPAPRRGLHGAYGHPYVLDQPVLPQGGCQADDRDRIVSGFAQRQPCVTGQDGPARYDQPGDERSRFQIPVCREKAFDRQPPPAAGCVQLDLRVASTAVSVVRARIRLAVGADRPAGRAAGPVASRHPHLRRDRRRVKDERRGDHG